MQVVPALNGKTFDEVYQQLEHFKVALPFYQGFFHLDVTDGIYSAHPTWNRPEELPKLTIRDPQSAIHLEIHLMVKNPEEVVDQWLQQSPVKRIIFHGDMSERPEEVVHKCHEKGIEVGISVGPETAVEMLFPYVVSLDFVQVLTVNPGAAGQLFGEDSLKKIRALRAQFPNVTIEVDGGVNPTTAKLAKEAGATVLVSASYLLNSSDMRKAYEELATI